MALSMAQAKAVAQKLGVDLPKKDNGYRKSSPFTLRRLPLAFRKAKKNAPAYRLSATTAKELEPFLAVAGEHGRSVCIVYKNEEN